MVDINPICKYALLIGINYRGTGVDLKGCINDVTNMADYLVTQRGYLRQNITILTDNTTMKPSSYNIQNEISVLVNKPGARELWLHYSGHGTYTRDTNGDEKDRRDECIVPLDYRQKGFIIDDILNSIVKRIPAICRMVCLFDSCYSGSVLDLKYIVNTNNTCTVDNTSSNVLGKIILISGCTDTQTSADAFLQGKWAGAMTTSFLACAKRPVSYMDLVANMRSYLVRAGFVQIPVLTCSMVLTGRDTL